MRTHLYLYLVLLGAFISVQAFTFSTNVPSQCGNFEVSWTGCFGQRVFNKSTSDAFSDGSGKFNIPHITFGQGLQFFVAMSDATGFATGGISPLITMTPPSDNYVCDTTQPGGGFEYLLITICSNATIQPVTIFGLVPGGTAVVLNVPNPSTEFIWNAASVPAGIGIYFAMSDSQNRTGNVLLKVSNDTGDSSCLNSSSPSVTVQGTSSTSSTKTTPTSPLFL
ncbi:hypothetical protein BGW80DRAFT_1247365 [Lactifluus volemus]|nr:hypothetical protein BGW80DRAFT_1247365 [Lactifluus volemus]